MPLVQKIDDLVQRAANTLSITPTAGNSLIAIGLGAGATSALVISDNAGNTWHPLTNNFDSPTGLYFAAWLAFNVAGSATTVLSTPGVGPANGFTVCEYSGLSASSPLTNFSYVHLASTAGLGANGAVGGALTTISASSLLFSWGFDFTGNAALTAGTSPIAFTNEGTSIFAAYTPSTATIEDATVSSGTPSATFGTVSGNHFDDIFIFTVAINTGSPSGPQVISQVQNSSATTLTSLAAPAITPSASDSLAVFTLSSTGSGLILNDAGVGNNYRHVGGGNSGGTFFLDAYLAQNVIGSPTTITVSAGAASIYAIAVVDVKQCAINNGALGFNVHAQTGSGTAGANLIFSNTIPLANPALMLAINVDLGLLGACTAGTSPIAFTGQTPIWATFGAGTAVAVIESALINSTQQATFGSTAANKSDNFITLAMDIGYFLTFTLQPFTPVQFFVTDTVIQM